jgi:hypothetical protein
LSLKISDGETLRLHGVTNGFESDLDYILDVLPLVLALEQLICETGYIGVCLDLQGGGVKVVHHVGHLVVGSCVAGGDTASIEVDERIRVVLLAAHYISLMGIVSTVICELRGVISPCTGLVEGLEREVSIELARS